MINFIGFTALFTFAFIIVLLLLGVWVWALVDCIKSEKETTEKIIWILVIFLFSILGAILYFLLKDQVNVEKKHKKNNKKLMRSDDNKVIAGVCGGIAHYFGVDTTIIRLLWVVLILFSAGTGILLYLIAALIMPSEKQNKKPTNENSNTLIIAAASVIIVIVLAIMTIAAIAITQFDDTSITKGVETSTHIIKEDTMPLRTLTQEEQLIMVTQDHIRAHPYYSEVNGATIHCESQEEPCDEYADPFMVTKDDCYELTCTFMSAKGIINATAHLKGKRLQELHFTPNKITTVQDCKRAQYEVLYPDCEGCPLQCDTPQGLLNVTNDSLCDDLCGDGTCQEMVCQGEGCPCAETAITCPQDCS